MPYFLEPFPIPIPVRSQRSYPQPQIEQCKRCGSEYDTVIHTHTKKACNNAIADKRSEAGYKGWTTQVEDLCYDEEDHWKKNLGNRLCDGFLMMQDDDMPWREWTVDGYNF